MKLASFILPASIFTMALAAPPSLYVKNTTLTDPSAESVYCGLLASSVNCRSCASTSCGIEQVLTNDYYYLFTCYTIGQNVGGNYAWDYYAGGCYVSAHYTDSSCTTSTLPPC
ncbi:hypothetical protein DL96DRAFT_1620635 [Flagelloscypha sp. PMI_526]|nr:hypothetical protein DL96DRAFT_1620635 [Flagelloscypha sp. PMI_526]